MTAANTAVIYASGSKWAGLNPKKVLLIDMDFEAPGLHYYNFAVGMNAVCANHSAYSYEVDGLRFKSLESLLGWMRQRPNFGFLRWLMYILDSPEVRASLGRFLPDTYRSRTPIMSEELLDAVQARVLEMLRRIKPNTSNDLDLHRHIIKVIDLSGEAIIGVLPAGEPQQPDFQARLRAFNWRSFFDNAGYAVLSALYEYLLTDSSHRYEKILLDQNAGETLPSIANRIFAHSRVVVTGFNQQNQDGLAGLIQSAATESSLDDVRVVLSQYSGRQLARDLQAEPISGLFSDPVVSHALFAKEEQRRRAQLSMLQGLGIATGQTFLIDFAPDAVQREHFHSPQSASWNELVRLVVSIEKTDSNPQQSPLHAPREVRLLGEFVGVSEQNPSGAIGALRGWLIERLGGTAVGGLVTEHEYLAEMVENGRISLSESVPLEFPAQTLVVAIRQSSSGATRRITLSDFDIVAVPAYLLPHIRDQVEVLKLDSIDIYAEDRIGPVDLGYLNESIVGLETYGYLADPVSSWPLAYPLFVDYQLLAVNRERIVKDNFKRDYFWREQRRFRGFPDPADVLAAARAAKENNVPADRLIMTLETKHVAQWYEWQTIIALFGGVDFDIATPWDDPMQHSRLTSKETVRATRFYLELSTYARKDSETTSWDRAIKLFFSDKQVGMAFVFPDAIPLEYRLSTADSPFIYTRLPRHDIDEESSALYPEECWLLVVPKNRRPDGPSVRDLTQLLTEFLCYQNQKRYQELGGVTPHRRVIDCVDLWTSSPFLPLLSRSTRIIYAAVRMCSPSARSIARKIVEALDDLRGFVESELGRHHTDESSNDYLWHKDEFVDLIEDNIKRRFERVLTSVPAVGNVDPQ
jgi:hypothetical protein